MNCPVNVLDLLTPQTLEHQLKPVTHLLVDSFGDAHSARFRQSFQTCGHIDPISLNVVTINDNVTEIDANPEHNLRPTSIARCYPLLHRRATRHRIEPDFYGASMLLLINRDKYNSLSQSQKNLLHSQAKAYESAADAIIIKKGHIDDARIKKAGVKSLKLEGNVRKAYLSTIYGAKWAQNDKQKYIVDYKKLKAKLYADPTN